MKVMKDKLVKTGHKGIYYKMKKISLFSLLFVTLGVAVTIPTYYSNIDVSGKVTSAEQISEVKEDEMEDEIPVETTPKDVGITGEKELHYIED